MRKSVAGSDVISISRDGRKRDMVSKLISIIFKPSLQIRNDVFGE